MGWIADLLKEIPSAARFAAEAQAMEKENLSLKAENESLKTENGNLREVIQGRNNIIQQQKSHIENLSIGRNDTDWVNSRS